MEGGFGNEGDTFEYVLWDLSSGAFLKEEGYIWLKLLKIMRTVEVMEDVHEGQILLVIRRAARSS
ncbi:hypothetical protein KP509_11G046900 [Ceratopteris richardii]|uniref:Uncharacterized protein n=1 Tax=Ceratopteris richardii TaxID=49495 RepID=A0A8T2TSJ8_CERRI|nr:hypothetical protein KP509_11G046900 [Ceratopteris richardii]